jgi:PEP-CTERM motif
MRSCLVRSYAARTSLAVACLSVGLGAQAFGAVTAPYSDSLSVVPGDAASNFRAVQDRAETATWTAVAGGAQRYVSDNTWAVCSGGALVSVDNLGGTSNTDFVVSANVTPTSLGVWSGSTGLVAASSTDRLGGWSSSYYAGELGLAGSSVSLWLTQSNPGDYATGLTSVPFGAVNLNTTYAMTLLGHYTPDGLTLSFTVTEAGNPAFTPVTVTTDIAAADIPANLGNSFGVRDTLQAGSVTLTYSNFAVGTSVPEPVSLGIIGLSAMGLMARRRKSA